MDPNCYSAAPLLTDYLAELYGTSLLLFVSKVHHVASSGMFAKYNE